MHLVFRDDLFNMQRHHTGHDVAEEFHGSCTGGAEQAVQRIDAPRRRVRVASQQLRQLTRARGLLGPGIENGPQATPSTTGARPGVCVGLQGHQLQGCCLCVCPEHRKQPSGGYMVLSNKITWSDRLWLRRMCWSSLSLWGQAWAQRGRSAVMPQHAGRIQALLCVSCQHASLDTHRQASLMVSSGDAPPFSRGPFTHCAMASQNLAWLAKSSCARGAVSRACTSTDAAS